MGQKIDCCVDAQGKVNLANKTHKHSHSWRHPQNPKPKTEKKFQ